MPAPDHRGLSERLDYSSIADYAKNHPDMDGEAIGRALTRGATRAQLLAYAIEDVCAIVESVRRHWAREAEDRAAQERTPEAEPEQPRHLSPESLAWAKQHNERERASRRERCEQMLADPAQRHAGKLRYGRSFHDGERAEFRQWAGERFAAWYDQARALAAEHDGVDGRDFDAMWHPGGYYAYWSEHTWRRAQEAIAEWAAQIRLETTRELLGTLFALGDGTSVTWGQATIGEHEQRIAMLAKNATGVIETAARHQAAIRMIKDAGVDCLADLAGPDDEAVPGE